MNCMSWDWHHSRFALGYSSNTNVLGALVKKVIQGKWTLTHRTVFNLKVSINLKFLFFGNPHRYTPLLTNAKFSGGTRSSSTFGKAGGGRYRGFGGGSAVCKAWGWEGFWVVGERWCSKVVGEVDDGSKGERWDNRIFAKKDGTCGGVDDIVGDEDIMVWCQGIIL